MEKLIKYLSEYTDIEESKIKGNSELVVDLGLTSYDIVEILCDIEELYGVEIDNQKIAEMKTVDAVSYTHLTLPTICSV